MLFTESQLHMNIDPFSILDEAIYLTEKESTLQPQMIPVIENKRIGMNVIGYKDLSSISEDYGIGLEEALIMVATSCNINPSNVVVSIDEADVIEDPSILTNGMPYVIAPLSENDCESVYTKMILQMLGEEDVFDEDLCVHLLTEETYEDMAKKLNNILDQRKKDGNPFTKEEKKEWRNLIHQVHPDLHGDNDAPSNIVNLVNSFISRSGGLKTTFHPSSGSGNTPPPNPPGGGGNLPPTNTASGGSLPPPKTASAGQLPPPKTTSVGPNPNNSGMSFGKKAAIGAGIAAAVGGGIFAYKQYQNRPKSVIAKRIAALRGIYQKFLRNAQANPEKAGIFKRMAAKILGVIDKLMAFLQRKADGK